MKKSIFIFLLIHSYIILGDECVNMPALSEVQKLEKLVTGVDCKPLDKNTWTSGVNSPCDCVTKKDLYSKLNSIDKQRVYGRSFSAIENDLEQNNADSINNLLLGQLEQSVRLDIYIKKGIISTDDTLSSKTSDSESLIQMPASCRINKISELLDNIKKLADSKALKCDINKLNRRLVKIFDGKSLAKWTEDNQQMIETTVMNEISPKDRERGMCIPYKSYLSFNSSNSLRPTYLSVALALKNDFKEFQKWARDRSNPSDVSSVIGKNMLKDNPNFNKDGIPTDNNKKYSDMLGNVLLRSKKTPLESISADDIRNLIKTDPLFERIVSDENFFKTIIANPKFPKISENDSVVIKEIAKSQNKSCDDLYGKDLIASSEQTTQNSGSRGGRTQSTIKESDKLAKKYDLKDQNLLTQYLCDDNFSKNQLDSETIGDLVKPLNLRSGAKLSKEDAELVIVDHLYCKKENQSTDTSIILPKPSSIPISPNELFKSMLNPALRPNSDLVQSGEVFAGNKLNSNNYQRFNKSVCEHVPSKCKNATNEQSSECSISSISINAIDSMISQRFGNNVETKKELIAVVNDLVLSDKDVKLKLAAFTQLSKDDVNTLVLLRQQTPEFIKLKAKSDIKYYVKDMKPTEDIDAYIERKGGIATVLGAKEIPTYISKALSENKNIDLSDNIYAESITDTKASYFSNYFALAEEKDQATAIAAAIPSAARYSTGNSNYGGGTLSPGQSENQSDRSVTTPSITDAGNNGPVNPGVVVVNNPETQPTQQAGYQRKSFGSKTGRSIASTQPELQEVAKEVKVDSKKEEAKLNETESSSEDDKKKISKSPNIGTSALTLTSSSSNSNTLGTNNSNVPGEGSLSKINSRNTSGNFDNTDTKALEDRIDSLNNLADEMNRARNNSSDQDSIDRQSEIEQLRDQIKRVKARNVMDNKINNIRNAANNSISDRASNNFTNNRFNDENFDNRNYANPYDPMDRGNTGRREPAASMPIKPAEQPKVAEDENSSNTSNAASTVAGKGFQSASGASLSSGSGLGGLGQQGRGGKGVGGRYPANENGEGDPDDICGYDQAMTCFFEYNSIFHLPNRFPTLAKFVEYLQLQGRSFKAIEVYKYKNKSKPTKYFIHEYEPSKALTENEKQKLYEEVKRLTKNYKTNYKRLKFLASQVYEEKKYEITKQEAKELQPMILRFEDLNKLIDRRTREQ